MPSTPIDIPSFAIHLQTLLNAELAAESAATTTLLSSTTPTHLARAGLAITNLVLSSQRTGLGGKTVLELEQDSAIGKEGLSEHGIRVGDVVRVGEQPKGGEKKGEKAKMEGKGVEGVVVRLSAKGVQVALGEQGGEEGWGGRLWVVKLANEVTYKRMNQTMERLKKMEERDYSTLIRVLFGLDSPTSVPPSSGEAKEVQFFDSTLNESQKEAVRFAMASKEVALIHGPPGTGKTYTLIELILQMIQRKLRVLVCGPSNISVDNIVERLAPHKIPIVRLGHPARLLPSVLSHSLDILTRTSEAASIVQDVRKEMDAKQASIKKTRSGRERRAIYSDIKELRKEYREREKQCVSTLVGSSKVVLATLHGAGGHQLRSSDFDVVIIDEASQALEPQCWIPLLTAKKLILAGDHLQLPPTVKSQPHSTSNQTKARPPSSKLSPGSNTTLETTLFDRLLTLHGPSIKKMLTTQYRMHSLIMTYPSQALYSSALIAAPSVATRLLTDLPYPVAENEDTKYPLIYYDTQGGSFPEDADSTPQEGASGKASILSAESKSNHGEALLAIRHLRSLLASGVKGADIALLSPYNAQVSLLSSLLRSSASSAPPSSSTTITTTTTTTASEPEKSLHQVEIGSIDGFQGREKEVVILSLVRSNEGKEIGFLGEKRRLNVAVTRARRQLVIIGDGETVAGGGGGGGGGGEGKGGKGKGKGEGGGERGFLRGWVGFLEEEAELRYPDFGEVVGGQ